MGPDDRTRFTLKKAGAKEMLHGSPVLPYHPGAIRYYKEKKLWMDDLEKKQMQLITEIGISK